MIPQQPSIDNTAVVRQSVSMIDATEAARTLARRRKGIKEVPSERKRTAALANLEKARQTWRDTDPADRKRTNPTNEPS